MKYPFILLLTLSTCWISRTQPVVEGKVLDADSGSPIQYANIGIAGTALGTISNEDGIFRLQVPSGSDTLLFSYIGYETLAIPATGFPRGGNVYLKAQPFDLTTAVVTPNNYLYDILLKCKSRQSPKKYTAKTYYQLDSYMNGYPVEMLECYYNGEFFGTKLEALHLKNGRIYLADYNKHYFTNLETSKAIIALNLFATNAYFPIIPFGLGKSKLIKTFSLQLVDTYRDNGLTYHIAFKPKDETRRVFSGEVWIDSAGSRLLKISLSAKNAVPHPFIPIWPGDSIISVDLDIHQSFKEIGGQQYVDVVDFNYNMVYRDRKYNINRIQTDGVIRAYDVNNSFILPFYEYDPNASDYRKISGLPYNDFFWENRDSIVISEKQKQNRRYFESHGIMLHQTKSFFPQGSFFQDNNITWSATGRVKIKELKDSADISKIPGYNPSGFYRLKVHVFLDINTNRDKIVHTLSKTIFDVFFTYYLIPTDPTTDCFANIYFDMMEMERRDLEKEINASHLSPEEIKSVYLRKMEAVKQLSQRYFRETEGGQNIPELTKWNKYVYTKLGIDNMALFGLYDNTK